MNDNETITIENAMFTKINMKDRNIVSLHNKIIFNYFIDSLLIKSKKSGG